LDNDTVRGRHILILMHPYQQERRQHYLIDALCAKWREQGLESSYIFGTQTCPDGNLLFNQVDLTLTPAVYADYLRCFVPTVNGAVLDISKRSLNAQLLNRDDNYSGAVIVKTNNNGGGQPEFRLACYQHHWQTHLRRGIVNNAEHLLGKPFAWRKVLNSYPIYDSLSLVPAGVFRNPALVVQRFLPEREGNRYFMRHYLFLGDHSRSVRVAASEPFMKRVSSELVDENLPIPQPVLDLRQKLGMEFGKIDYVMPKGETVILDVNRTPTVPGGPEATARTVADLAEGIWSLLP
jgi:hypothetical protein